MRMKQMSPVIVKLGGSLLTLPDLCERLDAVVNLLSPRHVLFIVGGGAAADVIRRLDDVCGLTATQAHWDAIAAMTLNAAILSRVSTCLPVVSNRIDADTAWRQLNAVLLDTSAFLREEMRLHSRALPESWSVTSDSIAAFVAIHWPAKQVVFCKACDLMSPHIERLCQDGLLDEWLLNLHTPLQVAGVQLQWLNLRASIPRLQPIGGPDSSNTPRGQN